MTMFFIVAALLVLAAILFIVPPLLRREETETDVPVTDRRTLNITIYRDQIVELERDLANDVITKDHYTQSRQELERRMLEDVGDGENATVSVNPGLNRATVLSAVIVAGLIPLVAAGVYMQLGTPATFMEGGGGAPMAAVGGADPNDIHDQINQMVAALEERLNENPNDAEGWAMLGRSYLALERFDRALPVLDRAVSLNENDPQLLVDYADALAMIGGQSLEGRPRELIDRALVLDPTNQKALWLAGTAEYEQANFEQALVFWRRLYEQVPPGSEAARAMESNIAEVESLMTGEEAVQAPRVASAGGGGGTIKAMVGIDGAIRDQVDASDTVFIFARAADGTRMPLAVLRAQVKDLPTEYVLDDSMAMDPSLSLSQFSEVIVVARVSRSGNAIAQSGDLQGASGVVRTGDSQSAQVMINEIIP